MKLYLISEDIILCKKWAVALADLNPVSLNSVSFNFKDPSIVMVLDRNISDESTANLKKFFENRVMILSMIPNFSEAQRFLQLGAMGYGNAMMHEYHLHSAYQALEEGKVWLHPDFISLMISQIRSISSEHEKSLKILDTLSKREQEVAILLGSGSTHQEVADALDITVRTVKAHATSIYQKLDVKDRLALSLLLHT